MIAVTVAGFLLGIAGSMHCAGMCGPLVMALPVRSTTRVGRVLDRVVYNLSRLATYGAMGALVGIGAGAFDLVGYGQIASLVAGALMIITAASQLLWHLNLVPTDWVHRYLAPLRNAALAAAKDRRRSGMILLGIVNGLLPCGLVTSALVGSAVGGDVASGVAFMASFGLGTTPMMLALSFSASELRQRLGVRLGLVLPVVAILVGGLVMLRGMALGIPFVSPSHAAHHAQAACCVGK